jgi:hypothetical protein
MDYDNNDCIVFSDEEKLMEFLKNGIVEVEVVNKNNSDSKNYYDFKKITSNLTKSVSQIMKYNVGINVFKHMIISTSSLNEQHILIVWKTTSSYGFIENEDLDENNLIFKIDFRTILKDGSKLFMKLDWFEFLEDNISIDCNKNELVDSIMQYIFNYANYLKINNIKLDMDGIITKGYINKYMKNNNESVTETNNNNTTSTQTEEEEEKEVISDSSDDINKSGHDIDYSKVYLDGNESEDGDDFIIIS